MLIHLRKSDVIPEEGESPPRDRTMSRTIDAED
jgi:hypothetical protein